MLPLTALRTFDLVARHGSFSEAARELNVTRPAVSKQILRLEALVGRQLVIRSRPSVSLTDTGQQLASSLLLGFDTINASFRRVQEGQEGANTVRILVDRDFASAWLAKHIGGFLVENPGVAIEVMAERNGLLRRGENFSFRIFYGPVGYFSFEDLTEEKLCDWIDIPLCTPDYAAEHLSDGTLRNTARFLIDRNYDPRKDWFAHSGVADPGPEVQVSKFNDTSMCLSAALSGAGITIADSFMALEAIQSGRLVAPFKLGLRSTECYSICHAAQRATSKVESRFRKWLLREISRYQASVESILLKQGVTVASPIQDGSHSA